MSPNEITTLIAKNYGKELDVPFKKMVYEQVKYWRATLIKQSLDKARKDSKYFRQTILLPLVRIDAVSTIMPETNLWIAETAIEVPLPIRISDQDFDYVGGVDGISPFGYADDGSLQYLLSDPYVKLFPHHQYINRKVRVNRPYLVALRISGIFNSPEEAMVYETVPAQPMVDWWNRDMPISGDVEQRVVQCLLKVDFEKTEGRQKTDDYQTPVNKEDL